MSCKSRRFHRPGRPPLRFEMLFLVNRRKTSTGRERVFSTKGFFHTREPPLGNIDFVRWRYAYTSERAQKKIVHGNISSSNDGRNAVACAVVSRPVECYSRGTFLSQCGFLTTALPEGYNGPYLDLLTATDISVANVLVN